MNDLIFITIMLVYFGVPLAVFIGGFLMISRWLEKRVSDE